MNNPIHDLKKIDSQIEQAKANLVLLQQKRNDLAKFMSSSEKSAKKAINGAVKR